MARTFSESVKAFGAKQVLGYLQKDPEKHIPQIIDWLEKYGGKKAMPGQLAFRYFNTSKSINSIKTA